jgi:hypothetical protein
MTQQYDSYQWYKNNNPIAGATNQFYVVSENDMLKNFKVAATLDGCTETSPAVVVDGWVFLLPYVIHSGDQGYYDPQFDATILCIGDTLILTMGLPYEVNVQWYDSGTPIPGATNPVFMVTEKGSYTACGAPAVCPDYISCLGVDINVIFGGGQPFITLSNDTLFSTTAESYQWYLDGSLIPGATNEVYVPGASGDYTVQITDVFGCTSLSEVFQYMATSVNSSMDFLNGINVYPQPAKDFLVIQFPELINGGNIIIHDLIGRIVWNQKVDVSTRELYIDCHSWESGLYVTEIHTESIVNCFSILKQ